MKKRKPRTPWHRGFPLTREHLAMSTRCTTPSAKAHFHVPASGDGADSTSRQAIQPMLRHERLQLVFNAKLTFINPHRGAASSASRGVNTASADAAEPDHVARSNT